MKQLSDKSIAEFKSIFKKEYGKELTDEEARESAQNLIGFVEILVKSAYIDLQRRKRLEKEPDGFHLEEGKYYNCIICYQSISGSTSWWDLEGPKCLNCQRAVKEGIIPKEACHNRNSWIANWELKSKYSIHYSKAIKLINEGKLKPRNILTNTGAIHYRLFLLEENPYLLQLLKSKTK